MISFLGEAEGKRMGINPGKGYICFLCAFPKRDGY